jgi:hypothetical protein
MVLNVADVSAQKKKQLIAAGKWFPFQGKVFGSEAARTKAQAASTKNKGAAKGKAKKEAVDTSSLFWVAKPGKRETVERRIVIDKSVAELACLRFGADLYKSNVGVGATRWDTPLPAVGELTGITVEVECGLLPREVKIQAVVVVAETLNSVAGIDWKVIKKLSRSDALKLEDVQSTDAVHRVPIKRPNNSDSTAPSCLVAMFRAVDSDTPATEKVTFTIVAKFSVLKAGTSGVSL